MLQTPKNKFIESLQPKNLAQSIFPKSQTPVYPTPSGQPVGGMSYAKDFAKPAIPTPKTVTTSNQSATKPIVKTPTSTLSPEGQKFTQTLLGGGLASAGYVAPQANIVAGSTTSTPPVSTIPHSEIPKVPSATDTAFANYIKFLTPSAKVGETQSAYNTAVADQSKTYAGFEGQGRGIPTGIVRGTQEKYLRQTQPELARLRGEIDIAQDEQTGLGNVAKAIYDREVSQEQESIDREKPIEVGGVLYQKQSDGSYKALTSSAKTAEGFTLGKDQARYDAQGNLIAGGTSSTTGTGIYQAGSNPTVDAYIKGIQSGSLKISDVPNDLQNQVALGMANTQKPQSEISKTVLTTIDELLANPKLDNISGLLGQTFLGGITGDAALAKNKYNQLKSLLSLDNIKYLKGTGAISDAEQRMLSNAASALGRNLSDSDFRKELIKLKDGLASIKDNQIAPDEEQFLRSQGYTEDEINQLKLSFNTVGKTIVSNIPQRNKNPGNIKAGGLADSLAIGKDNQGHLIFPDEATGFKAMQMDIEAKINGNSKYLSANPTIQELGKVYAEDPNWGKRVASILGISPTTKTKMIPINNLVQAIAKQEGYYA